MGKRTQGYVVGFFLLPPSYTLGEEMKDIYGQIKAFTNRKQRGGHGVRDLQMAYTLPVILCLEAGGLQSEPFVSAAEDGQASAFVTVFPSCCSEEWGPSDQVPSF